MSRITFFLIAVLTVAGVVAFTATESEHSDEEAAPIFGIKIPPGYRDWRLISVAHEAANLLTTANPPTGRSTRPALPATNLSKLATLSSRATHLNSRTGPADVQQYSFRKTLHSSPRYSNGRRQS